VDEPRRPLTTVRRVAPVALLAGIPLAFLAVAFLWPLATVVMTGLGVGRFGDSSALADVLGDGALRGVLWFTTWQAALSTVCTLVVGLPASWAFARGRFRGRRLAWSLLVVPFVLPTVVVGAALLAVDDRARGSLLALLVAHVMFNVAVVIRLVGGAWARLDPRVEDAAAVLGASPWQVARRVSLPLLAPTVLGAASIVFVFCFTSFGVVVALGGAHLRTVEVEVYSQVRSLGLSTAAALTLVQLVVVGVLLVGTSRLQQRWSVRLPVAPPAAGADRRVRTGGERVVAAASLASVGALVAVPLLALVARSLQVGDGWGLRNFTAMGAARRGSLLFVSPADAIRTSLWFAVIAASVAVVLGLMLSAALVTLERRSGRRTRSVVGIDAVVMLPLATSAVTIALGIVLAFDGPPLDLRGERIVVPLAQALVAIPFVVRLLLPALRAVDGRWRDAATTLGASPWRVWRQVDLPLVGRPLLASIGFAAAISLGEFGATALLVRADAATLPVSISRLLSQPGPDNIGQAMAASVVLAALSAAVFVGLDRTSAGGLDG